jgi:hypothetical protein
MPDTPQSRLLDVTLWGPDGSAILNSNGLMVQGNVAHDAADSGNPVKIGGRARTSNPTAVSDLDRVDTWFDQYGIQRIAIGEQGGTNLVDVAALSADAISTALIGLKAASIGYALAPDGNLDRLRTMQDSGIWFGSLATSPLPPGSSDPLAARVQINNSATRATLVTPTSGTRIIVISLEVMIENTNAQIWEAYFGTGATIATTAGNEIANNRVDDVTFAPQFVWSSAWPIGAVDEVVSVRTTQAQDQNTDFVIHYVEV